MEWVAEAIAGRVPLSVTVAEPSVAAQIAFARAAIDVGASWIVLQPPPVRNSSEAELIRFFGKVADSVDLPIGIQNAPEYTGIGLSPAGIATLARQHANFSILKGEGPVLSVRTIIEETEGLLAVFNGRGGLELTDNLRAGCAGMVPGSEACDIQKRVYDLATSNNPADREAAEQLYQQILPLLVFLMQSLDNFLCYGKRLAALRYDIGQVYARGPSTAPTKFGLSCLLNAASSLWPNSKIASLT
jgi:4-hydroxy-tetrahydrodipicolinate synthase